MYSLADGKKLAARLGGPDKAVVEWLCERIEELERQVAANMQPVEGVCSICGVSGWYYIRQKTDPAPSPTTVMGTLGAGVVRLLMGQVVLHDRGGALICTLCERKPT